MTMSDHATVVKVGIIGTGFIANSAHLPAYASIPNVQIVAACDIIPERVEAAAKTYGIAKTYTDYREMLREEELDAISICTPNNTHAEIAIEALGSGCHVLCEKPMAICADEAQAMLEAAERAEGHLMIAYPRRFNPEAQYVKRLAEAGYFGRIYHGRAVATRRRGVPMWGKYLEKETQGGGPLLDIGSHSLDMTLWLMDKYDATEVLAVTYNEIAKLGGYNPSGRWEPDKFEVEDAAFGLIRFRDGSSVFVEASWALHTDSELGGSILYGSKAGAEVFTIGKPGQPMKLFGEESGRLLNVIPAPLPQDGKTNHRREIEFFVIECVMKGTKPPVCLEDDVLVTKIIDALYRSAELGQAVKIQ